MQPLSFNCSHLENKIRQSNWWAKAAATIDSHYSNTSGVMLTHHLEAVYENVSLIFNQPEEGFIGELFTLLRSLKLHKKQVLQELKIAALLHDIGKTEQDKSQIIPHPITGKAAHLRHGIVGLMAAMEIIGEDLIPFPQQQTSIYRTVELHDVSYGLYREFLQKESRQVAGLDLRKSWFGQFQGKDMVNKLGKLTTTSLATTGAYRTLSDLGVKTNQDGTLALDSTRLDAAMLADPAGVAQMINPSVSNASTPGLAKIVSDLKTSVEASGGSLAGSKAKYDKLAAEYTKQMEKLDKDMDSYETQLSNVYSAMGTKLAALKATQTYLNNQIDAWNNTGKN